MEKKIYMSPTMLVVKLQHQTHLMDASVQSLGGNSSMSLGGNDASYVEGGGDVRVKEQSNWDEEW